MSDGCRKGLGNLFQSGHEHMHQTRDFFLRQGWDLDALEGPWHLPACAAFQEWGFACDTDHKVPLQGNHFAEHVPCLRFSSVHRIEQEHQGLLRHFGFEEASQGCHGAAVQLLGVLA